MSRALHPILALLSGCALTVAIAWAASIWTPLPYQVAENQLDRTWPVPVPEHWPQRATAVTEYRGFGVWWSLAGASGEQRIWAQVAGLPFDALYAERSGRLYDPYSVLQMPSDFPSHPGDGLRIPSWAPATNLTDRMLPVRPLWFGFVANTVNLAIPYLGVVYSWRWRLHRRRSLRGQCVRCAHPIGSAAQCPECGHESGKTA